MVRADAPAVSSLDAPYGEKCEPPPPPCPAGSFVVHQADNVLVVVGEMTITEEDLRFLMLSRSVPEELRPRLRRQFIEQLIDRRLMQAFLAERKAVPDKILLEEQVQRLYKLLEKNGHEPQSTLEKIGFTDERLREELALPLAWKVHVNRMVTPQRLRDYFQKHKQQFDGTKVRAAQILIKVDDPEDEKALQAALEKLQALRKQILDGKIAFEQAAKEHSQSPTAENGGDMGLFPYRGKMPVEFTRVAFALEPGEVSEPFTTRFGVHLLSATERRPGDYSLEDVRPAVLKQLSDELWAELVAQQRAKVNIEWKIPLESGKGL